ncbi:MAG TPA: thioesterase family protein [Symbiobacteriaceae bacterium]|jgi:fluoroacetyl-CoA thioesterase|nr:thioesterase family protein [Symbiobacteriaceae bacterium]
MHVSLVPGLTGEAHTTVTEASTAAAVGSGGIAVFSTPMMIALMENAALQAVQPYLAEGESTVGTLINIKHMAATPLGMQVRAVARLDAVEGRRLLFTIEAFDQVEKIGEGSHERVVITVERFLARVGQKRV